MRAAGVVRGAAAVVALVFVAVLSGCGHDDGTPSSSGVRPTPAHPDYAKLTEECQLVGVDKISAIVAATIDRPSFTGAICRWDGAGSAGNMEVTLNWFETGSLPHERALAEKLGYKVSAISVQGGGGIKQQRPNDPDSCGVSVIAFDAGVVGWWVQYLPGSAHPDPCPQAQKLAEASLSLVR